MKITNRKGENATELKLDMVRGMDCLPCHIKEYCLNGVRLNQCDFGTSTDKGDDCDDEDIMRYRCVNQVFKPWTDEENKNMAMAKYGITEEEYYEIQDKLESELCMGQCDWCV